MVFYQDCLNYDLQPEIVTPGIACFKLFYFWESSQKLKGKYLILYRLVYYCVAQNLPFVETTIHGTLPCMFKWWPKGPIWYCPKCHLIFYTFGTGIYFHNCIFRGFIWNQVSDERSSQPSGVLVLSHERKFYIFVWHRQSLEKANWKKSNTDKRLSFTLAMFCC